jgi:hypothetical protein
MKRLISVGRPKDVNYDYVQGNRMPDDPPTYNPSKGGYPLATSRTQTVPNVRSLNDVGQYPSEQQQQLNAYSVAPLAPYPQGGQYAINSDTGNTTTAASTNSFNRQRTVVSQGSLFNGAVSANSTVVNVFNFHPGTNISVNSRSSDSYLPGFQPTVSPPSLNHPPNLVRHLNPTTLVDPFFKLYVSRCRCNPQSILPRATINTQVSIVINLV